MADTVVALTQLEAFFREQADSWQKLDKDLGRRIRLTPGRKEQVLVGGQIRRASYMTSVFLDLLWPAGTGPNTNRARVYADLGWGEGAARQSAQIDWPQGTAILLPVTGLVIAAEYVYETPQPGDIVPAADIGAVCSYTTHASLQFADCATWTTYLPIVPNVPAAVRVPAFARDVNVYLADRSVTYAADLGVLYTRGASATPRGAFSPPTLPLQVPMSPDTDQVFFVSTVNPYTLVVQFGLTF